MFLMLLSFLLAMILYLISFLLSMKVKNSSKMSAFECGFSTVGAVYSSFSIHFFMVLLIFIVFELEVVLLLGCLFAIGSFTFLLLMLFIVGGIYLEWYLGKLSWMV